MNHKTAFFTIWIHLCVLLTITRGQAIQPANPNASADTRKVLTYLYDLPKRSENRLISGHLAGGSIGPTVPEGQDSGYRFKMDEIEYLQDISGQWVGLIGADYCAGWIKCPDPIEATMYYKQVNQGLIGCWNAGGLVTITTHQFDPRQLHKGGGYHKYLDWPPKDRLDISKLYTPGHEEYDNFRVIMDRWAEGLQELQEHGVVVMWRPYNEATNSGKWWCRQPEDQFKALYRYTFNYLTHQKKLNNLLWVYDAKPAGKNELNLSHYPGDEYVDVVGYTMNWDSGPVAQPIHPYPKKVFGCVEFNVRFDQKKFSHLDKTRDYDYTRKFRWMRDNLPYSSFFMSWDRLSGPYGCGTPESIKAMYNDPSVANRGQIDWRSVRMRSGKEVKP
ncbi:MAG TPA: glycosyl hydrolase [Sedimentisphaerales bacterium]|nr:glycosyl hydrolase [Sedimentisphaerales bacterium]